MVWYNICYEDVNVPCYIFLVLSKEVGVGEGRVISVEFREELVVDGVSEAGTRFSDDMQSMQSIYCISLVSRTVKEWAEK